MANHGTTPIVPAPRWEFYASLAAHYYVAARFAALAGYTPLCGNLMHHAIELLLKGGLIKAGAIPGGVKEPLRERLRFQLLRFLAILRLTDPPNVVGQVDLFLRRYGHRLKRLWKDFKKSHPAVKLSHFDAAIAGLDRWEEIRYPKSGISMLVDFGTSANALPPPSGPGMQGVKFYQMYFEDLDECFKELWTVSSLSVQFFRSAAWIDSKANAKTAYEEHNIHQI